MLTLSHVTGGCKFYIFALLIEVSVDFIQIIVTKYQKPDIFELNCGALKAGCTGCFIF